MESINLVLLSGLVKDDAATKGSSTTQEYSEFQVVTYRSTGKGRDKVLKPEYHTVTLANPGTIARHIKRGKAITIQGRVNPEGGISASHIHFPESRLKNE